MAAPKASHGYHINIPLALWKRLVRRAKANQRDIRVEVLIALERHLATSPEKGQQ